MQYPGRIIKIGETDTAIIRALKSRLNDVLALGNDPNLKLDASNPTYGMKMQQVVKLFQARNVDNAGRPLKQDGEVGSLTWEAIFGNSTVTSDEPAASSYLRKVLAVARAEAQKGVRERPRNSNRGKEVDAYMKRAGAPLGFAWCCAFTYWAFDEAAGQLSRTNPMYKTAGCLDHWNNAPSVGARRVTRARAIQDPSLVRPGMVFIMDHGRGLGHTGFVEKVVGGIIHTIEGNTDASKTREGGGVYKLTRKVNEINKGFLDYDGL